MNVSNSDCSTEDRKYIFNNLDFVSEISSIAWFHLQWTRRGSKYFLQRQNQNYCICGGRIEALFGVYFL